MEESMILRLIREAAAVRVNSYAPYSQYRVGAALLTKSGNIYTAVNVENASYPAGICAEQAVLSKAVSEGERDFAAIAVIGGKEPGGSSQFSAHCYPCGICRQVMSEFAGSDFLVITAKSEKDYSLHPLKSLLPFSFRSGVLL